MNHTSPISESQIIPLARLGATDKEIADALGCREDDLRQSHQECLSRIRAEFRLRVRAKQLQLAMEGDRAMLTLLVKGLPDNAPDSAGRARTAVIQDPSLCKDETDDRVFERS